MNLLPEQQIYWTHVKTWETLPVLDNATPTRAGEVEPENASAAETSTVSKVNHTNQSVSESFSSKIKFASNLLLLKQHGYMKVVCFGNTASSLCALISVYHMLHSGGVGKLKVFTTFTRFLLTYQHSKLAGNMIISYIHLVLDKNATCTEVEETEHINNSAQDVTTSLSKNSYESSIASKVHHTCQSASKINTSKIVYVVQICRLFCLAITVVKLIICSRNTYVNWLCACIIGE